jgi:hypothetical protein
MTETPYFNKMITRSSSLILITKDTGMKNTGMAEFTEDTHEL